jgi:hypothetical protein
MYRALSDLFYLADLSGNAAWRRLLEGRERGEEGEWEDALLPPIPPIHRNKSLADFFKAISRAFILNV